VNAVQVPEALAPLAPLPEWPENWQLQRKAGRQVAPPVPVGVSVVLIDNYDSFTFNLFHRLGEQGAAVRVLRNDAATPREVLAMGSGAVVISPGPCDPDRAGISCALIEQAAGVCPVLGVCLGHQAIGQVFGGRVMRAPSPMHGKISLIHHDGTGVFAGLPNPFPATRYHSLIVERASLPDDLRVTAWTDDGLIMGLQHRHLPVHGVQFHPESIETEAGRKLLHNFVSLIPARVAAGVAEQAAV
jgi:anthranilate synthase component 2